MSQVAPRGATFRAQSHCDARRSTLPSSRMAVQSRIHSTGRTAAKTVLSIGGPPAPSVARYGGGEPYAVVVNEPGGLLPYAKKHIGALQFADVATEVAMDAD